MPDSFNFFSTRRPKKSQEPLQGEKPKFLMILGALSKILERPGDFHQKIQHFYKVLEHDLGFHLGWIGLFEDNQKIMVGQGGFAPTQATILLSRRTVKPGDLADLISHHQSLIQIGNLQEDLRCRDWWPYAKEWNIQGAIGFPITYQGKCLGVGLLGSNRWGRTLDREAEQGIYLFGNLLGSAMLQDTSKAVKHDAFTSPLYTLADRLRQPQDADTIFQTVCAEVHERIQPSRTAIYWIDADSRDFWVRAMAPTVQTPERLKGAISLGQRFPLKELYSLHQALKADRLVSIPDCLNDMRGLIGRNHLKRAQLTALMAYPIIYQNELLGYLSVEMCREPRLWTTEEGRLLTALAHLIGVTTTQERLYEVSKRQALEQTLINQITRDIRDSLDPDQVLRSAVQRLGEHLNIDRCLVLNYSNTPEGPLNILHQYCATGVIKFTGNFSAPGSALEKQGLTSTTPVAIDDVETDFRFLSWRKELSMGATRSLLVCGTAYQGQPNGILCLHRCYAPQNWTQEERSIVQAVAEQVGVALGQAVTYHQAKEQAVLEHRLNQASRQIRGAGDSKALLHQALVQLTDVLDSTQAVFLRHEANGSTLTLADSFRRPIFRLSLLAQEHVEDPVFSLLERDSVSLENPFIQEVLADSEPVACGPNDWFHWSLGTSIKSLIAVRVQPIGVILILDDKPRTWSPSERQLCSRLVQEMTLAYNQACAFEKLQDLSYQLKQLNEYKSNMVGIASHEMRTPLASMRLYVETILNEPEIDSKLIRELMGGMEKECARLTHLLDDLTTLVNLEASSSQWSFQNVSVDSLIQQVVQQVKPTVTEFFTAFSVENLGGGLSLNTDSQKLLAVLFNLVDNACRHTCLGCHVIFRVIPQGQNILFTVEDNGPGIPKNKLDGLFQPFVRVQDVMNHSKGGAGLGLAICKETIVQMGGEITVHSEVGRGTTFKVLLPMHSSDVKR
jgi:signal transduction histidine kinase/transcriptional regulator with GAF, ATPase, and Fis domain